MSAHAGRLAIKAALRAHYPGQTPIVVSTNIGPLEEIRVYWHARATADAPHWHYITLGLSELGAKQSSNASVSGWGFELTARLMAAGGSRVPPAWPIRALTQLAEYVHEAKAPLADGHHVNLGTSVDDDAPRFAGFAFRRDAELLTLDTPNGLVSFLQSVTITAEESALMSRWSVASFLDLLATRTPLLVIDPTRSSLLDDPGVAALIRERTQQEGSAESVIVVETLTWQRPFWSRGRVRVSLGPADHARRTLPTVLRSRTGQGQPFRLVSGGRTLALSAGPESAWSAQRDTLQMTVSPSLLDELLMFLATDASALDSRALPGFVLALVV